MPRKLAKKFFERDGEPLNPKHVEHLEAPAVAREAISSLANVKPTKKDLIFEYFLDFRNGAKDVFNTNFLSAKSPWAFMTVALSILIATFVFNVPLFIHKSPTPAKYSLFSAIPLTLDSVKQELDFKDSRATKIDSTFEHFNCPMTGMGREFVKKADEYEIPYYITAAIAFQESSCGKNTPKVDGVESNNAWGWATYGESVHSFDSFEQGIDVVSNYLNKNFYSRGITDTCEIMKTYTPPSNGSWCEGVDYFSDFILDYKTPEF